MQSQDEKWVAHAPPACCGRATHRSVRRRETRIFGEGAENNTRGRVRYPSPTASFRLRMTGFYFWVRRFAPFPNSLPQLRKTRFPRSLVRQPVIRESYPRCLSRSCDRASHSPASRSRRSSESSPRIAGRCRCSRSRSRSPRVRRCCGGARARSAAGRSRSPHFSRCTSCVSTTARPARSRRSSPPARASCARRGSFRTSRSRRRRGRATSPRTFNCASTRWKSPAPRIAIAC